MRRHVLCGRMGAGDRGRLATAEGEVSTRIDLLDGDDQLQFGIGRALDDLAEMGACPTEMGVDLMVLAAQVHAADTRVSRDTESQDAWTRELRLVVPVSDPDRWQSSQGTLVRMLDFLTGDRWSVGFRARPRGVGTLVPTPPPRSARPAFDSLALFSGGLDSLINAIDLLHEGRTPLLISHAGEGATSDAQNSLLDALRTAFPGRAFDQLRLWMRFPKDLVEGSAPEPTTRGRSFLFFATGILAASGLGGESTLLVPENGFIALNIPLDPLRLGALSTRTTHPFYIARWNELLGQIGVPARIVNPYWNYTKGEMVSRCADGPLLRRVAALSLSCASPTKGRWRGHGVQHCGYCLPCLVRRAALKAGFGRVPDPTLYTVADLRSEPLDSLEAEGKQVRSFQIAVERLRAHPEFASILVHKSGSLADESAARQAELAGVYRRGLEEIGAFLRGVSTRPA